MQTPIDFYRIDKEIFNLNHLSHISITETGLTLTLLSGLIMEVKQPAAERLLKRLNQTILPI